MSSDAPQLPASIPAPAIPASALQVSYSGSHVSTVWLPDDKASDCYSCAVKFNLVTRKHHCRSCGLIICNRCSLGRAKLPAFGSDLVRICNLCSTALSAAQRGISVPRIRKFLKQCQEEDIMANRMYQQQKLIQIENSLLNPSMDQEKGRLDQARQLEALSNLRLNGGFLSTIFLSDKLNISAPIPISQHRFLLLSPAPARLLSISSLIYPTSNSSERSEQQLRFHLIRPLDEIQSIKPMDYTIGKTIQKGIQIIWNDMIHLSSGKTENATTNFCWIDYQQNTLESLQEYMEKIKATRKGEQRGSLVLRNENYDAALMEKLKKMKENAPASEGKEGKGKVAASPAAPSDSDWTIQDDFLATFHAHTKDHLMGLKVQMRFLDQHNKDMKTEVDWTIEEHSQLLKRLWLAFSGIEEFPGEKSEAWKSIGFQGADPTTDFRGMGLLAVKALVHAGEKYTADMRRLVEFQPHREYPLCTAGINLVALIADLLTLTRPDGYERPATKIPLFRVFCRTSRIDQQENHFAELLANLLPLLDRLWIVSNATYFAFPALLASLKERLVSALQDNPCSFPALIKMLNQQDLGLENAIEFLSPPMENKKAEEEKTVGDAVARSEDEEVRVIEALKIDDEADALIEESAPTPRPSVNLPVVLAHRSSRIGQLQYSTLKLEIEPAKIIPEGDDEDNEPPSPPMEAIKQNTQSQQETSETPTAAETPAATE